jgi:transcriptional regulator with XRE-family HTH domain
MPKPLRLDRHRRPPELHIGQWLTRLGVKPVELAREVEITESYVSELISNRKKNPSFNVLSDIADYLGVPLDALRRPPPSVEAIDAVGGLPPATIERMKARNRR